MVQCHFIHRHQVESEADASALGVPFDLRAAYLGQDAVVRVVGVDVEEVFILLSVSIRCRSRQLLLGELISCRSAPPELIIFTMKNLHPVACAVLKVAVVFAAKRERSHCKIRFKLSTCYM